MTRSTHYAVEQGPYGGVECYRLTVDHGGCLISFDTVRFYGGLVGLYREGVQKATLTASRLPSEVRVRLTEIADDAPEAER